MGKNDLVKNNMELFHQNATECYSRFPFAILVIFDHTKSLSQQLLQAFIFFLPFFSSISLISYSFWFRGFFVNITAINHNSSAQLAGKQKVNSKFCFTS